MFSIHAASRACLSASDFNSELWRRIWIRIFLWCRLWFEIWIQNMTCMYWKCIENITWIETRFEFNTSKSHQTIIFNIICPMSTESSPTKIASPRKTPPRLKQIATLQEGDSNFTLEVRVTSVSAAKHFGKGDPDSVFLHLSLMDETGLIS